MVTCRPGISFPLIKFSQYSAKPTDIHFVVLRQIYCYLRDTPDEGIYYWRKTPRKDLPIEPAPSTKDPNNYEPETRTQLHETSTRATVDSDYANDTTHRRSVTGIAIKIAGGAVFY